MSAPQPTPLTHPLSLSRTRTRTRGVRSRAALPVVAALALGLGTLAPAATAASHTPISRTALVSDPDSYVNPFIGTTNQADDFPGADVPFGMVQWSPDTPSRPDGGGYEYNDSSITGFSLTHLSGPGCPAEGDVPILPTVGAVDTSATDSFAHTSESASPGYYSVQTSNGVTTELTTTTRSGQPWTRDAQRRTCLSTAHSPRSSPSQARGALCLPTASENPPRTDTGRHRTPKKAQGRGARVSGVRESQQGPGISLFISAPSQR